jgi:hypothetical protein
MSRNRALVLALVVVLVVAVLGGRLAGSIEHWLMALHGRH